MECIERESQGLLHQPVDHEPMLLRIDVGYAVAGNHEVQAVGRDRAVEQMVRRAGGLPRGSPFGLLSIRTTCFSYFDGVL